MTERDALTVQCPECLSAVGRPCTDWKKKPLKEPCSERYERARCVAMLLEDVSELEPHYAKLKALAEKMKVNP
jgi:hypothetical protein